MYVSATVDVLKVHVFLGLGTKTSWFWSGEVVFPLHREKPHWAQCHATVSLSY